MSVAVYVYEDSEQGSCADPLKVHQIDQVGKTFDMYIGSRSKTPLERHQADRRLGDRIGYMDRKIIPSCESPRR